MDLRSAYPYWLIKNGVVSTFPSLTKNIKVDVAVMGAGISGALVAYYLTKKNLSVAILDKRHAGMGSTAASTSLLQYEIDTPLRKLCKMVGVENAVRSYKLCEQSITDLRDICKELHPRPEFNMIPSLQYASYKKHVKDLREEYELRLRYGFDVSWLSENDVNNLYCFDAPGAILSASGGSVDAYLLTHGLLNKCVEQGSNVYDNTAVTEIEYKPRHVVLHTDTGNTVNAKKLIIACGYESLKYIPKQVAKLNSTYALISEPVAEGCIWHKRSLIWETKVPYLYARLTTDNRVITGGYDDDFYDPQLRDSRNRSKTDQLVGYFNRKFPKCPIRADFYWSGTFASTKDGLPCIGSIPERHNTYFALGFGGNGITFSVIAAKMLTDMITGKVNKDADIFSFNR